MDVTQADIVFRLLLAALLGGAVGLEREFTIRPAGLRTHILVCVGSTVIMLVSAAVEGADPARIAAQVVSGIGFLGAGTILREGASVRGLTTAASLWVVAGIGLATGAGQYLPALAGTVLVVLTLVILGRLEKVIGARGQSRLLMVEMRNTPGQLGCVSAILGQRHLRVRNIQLQESSQGDTLRMEVLLDISGQQPLGSLVQEIAGLEGVLRVDVD